MNKHLKVLLGNNNIYTELVEGMKAKVRASAHVILTSSNYEEAVGNLSYRPFVNPYYVVEAHMDGLSKQQIHHLIKMIPLGWLQFIFVFTKINQYENFKLQEPNILYQFNGYRPTDQLLSRFIKNRTPHIDTDAKYKVMKYNLAGHYNLLEHYIDEINEKVPTTVAELKKIVPRFKRVNFWKLFNQLITGEKPKDSFRMLREYPNGGRFILKIFKEFSENLLELYEDFHDGKFNRRNLTTYKRKENNTSLKEYQLGDALTLFENYSYEFLLLLDCNLAKALKADDANYEVMLMSANILTTKRRAVNEQRRR